MIKLSAIIFDIDGTLSDVEHRRHHVVGKPKNWPAFFDAMVDDPPIVPVWELLGQFITFEGEGDLVPLFVSGRPEEYRPQTVDWLAKAYTAVYRHDFEKELPNMDIFRHDYAHWKGYFDTRLYMRGAKDTRDDTIVKREILWELRRHYNIRLVVDDRQKVVDMWREEGLVCLQCAPGDFDVGPAKGEQSDEGGMGPDEAPHRRGG